MRRSVVITGAGQGIGRASAERLAEDGWIVVGLELHPDLSTDLLRWLGERGTVATGDVRDRDALEHASALACERAPLGAWVNNAGVAVPGTLHEPDARSIERVLDVNIGGTLWGCSTAVRTFIRQRSGGAIVNISSIHGRRSFASHAAYDTSKGAIDALTRNVAVEYGPVGIRANAIAPGGVRTPLLEAGIRESPDPGNTLRALESFPPMRRIGEASEIASVVSFLLSDDASYLSGQTIAVDGAWTAQCAVSPLDAALADHYG